MDFNLEAEMNEFYNKSFFVFRVFNINSILFHNSTFIFKYASTY